MNDGHEEKMDTLKIADDVIVMYVANAVLKTKGVADFSPVFSVYKGIKVSQGDGEIAVDIYIIVDYGVKIPVVAWDIQENVKREVEMATDLPVKAVNIHVQGVRMKGEGDSNNEQN